MFCVYTYSFAGLIRRTPPPTFSDTAITDRYSDTAFFQLRAYWVQISWPIGSEKIVRTCATGGSRTLDFLFAGRTPYPLDKALRHSFVCVWVIRVFPAQSTLGADILVYWIGKIVRTGVARGSRTLDFLCQRRTPYSLS